MTMSHRWDLVRCCTSLMQVLQPEACEEHFRWVIDVCRYDDNMLSKSNDRTQESSNADHVLAVAYVKGLGRAVDLEDAEKLPPNDHSDHTHPESPDRDRKNAAIPWLTNCFIAD